jgi:peptide/nickel transport system ATP-binding protein
MTVGEAIREPMRVHGLQGSPEEQKEKVLELLQAVGMPQEAYDKYPHAFSGGQRQRIGIARTLAVQPHLVICDESVAALDVSVQAQVLNLLNDLKDAFEFSYLFISHDARVVQYMSDRTMELTVQPKTSHP